MPGGSLESSNSSQVSAALVVRNLAMVPLLVMPKIPWVPLCHSAWLWQLLLTAASGALAFPLGYLGMGIPLQLFL